MWSDNPIADAERYFDKQEEALEQLPRCSECHEPIQQDTAVCINDEYICDQCLEDLRVELMQW